MDSILVKTRLPFTVEELKTFFKEFNLFKKGSPGMTFDEFKKNFFPHLYLVPEDPDDMEDKIACDTRKDMIKN